jgi:hypothetical protein
MKKFWSPFRQLSAALTTLIPSYLKQPSLSATTPDFPSRRKIKLASAAPRLT